jgi:putative ABC transport system permease protein
VNGLRREHWTQVQSGWMIESARPLQAAQIAAARDVAAKTGLVIESRNTQASLATIRTAATAAGALIALGVLAMAVGLIRAEAAGDVRTLTAIGAASTTRRTLTATTAGTLALLGALLGSGASSGPRDHYCRRSCRRRPGRLGPRRTQATGQPAGARLTL